MREPRNPFRMRAAEQIETDSTFLRLFGPGALDILPQDEVWDKIQIIRSAPGAGKTSLFRLFTPTVLASLYELRKNDEYRELAERLKDLGAMDENGPLVLGIHLSCARSYASLDDLPLNHTSKERLLFALLNARIILTTLRGILELNRLLYPQDLDQIEFRSSKNARQFVDLQWPSSGGRIYDWARTQEARICEMIDSFDSNPNERVTGSEGLDSLTFLSMAQIFCGDKPFNARLVLTLDDAHKLTNSQRKALFTNLFEGRSNASIWIGERLEALSADELLGIGGSIGREYEKPIDLEAYWKEAPRNKKFENSMRNIADRRSSAARDNPIGSFDACLQGSIDGTDWNDIYEKAIDVISNRLRKRIAFSMKYSDWLRRPNLSEGSLREQMLQWRSLEIFIERDIRRSQLTLELPVPSGGFDDKDFSKVNMTAEFLVSREFKIPYYFGFNRLAFLSSFNIEQFLGFSGELFEEILSLLVLRRQSMLSPKRQEEILRKIARNKWEAIPAGMLHGRDVQRFLDSIRQIAEWETMKPNAPYAPGVTGIALTMQDRNKLLSQEWQEQKPEHRKLLNVLVASVSSNLLQVYPDRSQGKKNGKTWMILYLNRWLCLHFGLPINYGGWRPKKPEELARWFTVGVKIPTESEKLL